MATRGVRGVRNPAPPGYMVGRPATQNSKASGAATFVPIPQPGIGARSVSPKLITAIATGVASNPGNITLASGDILVGNASNVAAAVAMSGDATLNNAGAITLATVNTNVGTFASATYNAKGLATAAANLSGDATTSGSALTLATVNSNVGTFQGITVNGKGLVTAASNQSYLTGNQTITLSGDVSGSGTTAITATLATVNSNVGTFQGLTVNGKGLVTAAVNEGYWIQDADWSFSSHNLIGNVSGSAVPTFSLTNGIQLVGASGANGVQINTFAAAGQFVAQRADGTAASPATIAASSEVLLTVSGAGYNGTSYVVGANVRALTTQAFSSTATGTYLAFATTPTGSTGTTQSMGLSAGGLGGLTLPTAQTDEGAGTVNVSTGYFIGGSNIQTAKAATNKTTASPGSVTATSPTYKMLGFAGTITPKFNTAVVLNFTGSTTDATLADTVTLVLSYGTGGAPSNGGALAGTQVGAVYAFAQDVASDATGFSLTAVVTGLSAGTAYWLDLAVGSSGGHAITFGSTNCSSWEI
jgi:hypothetical protein